MTQANIDLFAAKVAQDPALLSALTSGATATPEFVARAVAAGQEAGLPFTSAEAEAWLATPAKTDISGELSDTQLESVAGGKTRINAPENTSLTHSDEVLALFPWLRKSRA